MPALQSQPEIITLEQYQVLPEDTRAEVYDGTIYNMASPSQIHQTILLELSSTLNSCVKGKKDHVKYYLLPLM